MKNLEVRFSGEVGYVGGDLLAIVYPVAECPQSRAEHRSNSKRIVESWNQHDALKESNAELLEALEYVISEGQVFTSAIEGDSHSTDFEAWAIRAKAAIAKAKGLSQ